MGERGVETDDPPYREHGARVSGLGATARPQTDVGGRGPRRDQIGCQAPGRSCRQGQPPPATGCPAPTRAIGKAIVASTRPLPEAFPVGARHDVSRPAGPTISSAWWTWKRHARHARRRCCRRAAIRFACLAPDAPSPWRAPRGCPLRQCWDRARCPLRRRWSQHCQRRHARKSCPDRVGVVSGIPQGICVHLRDLRFRSRVGGWSSDK